MTNLELHPDHAVTGKGCRNLIVILSLIAMAFPILAWSIDISANLRGGAWKDLNNLLAAMIGFLGLGLGLPALKLATTRRKASSPPDASSTRLLVLSMVATISPIPGMLYAMLMNPPDIPQVLGLCLLMPIPLSGFGIGLAAWQSGLSRWWVVGGLVFSPACIAIYLFLIS